MKPETLPAISMPEAADLGPSMLALNTRQRAFVFALFMLGRADPVDAARAAGYPDSGKSGIRVQAHRLAHHPKVQAAIDEWAKRSSKVLVPFARRKIIEIAENAQHKDQMKAALSLMSMGGHGPVTESKVTHEVILTREEKIAEITMLAKTLGRDPAEFLGTITDAEFVEVPAKPDEDEFADVEY